MAAAITAALTAEAQKEFTALTIINGIRKRAIVKDTAKCIRKSIRMEKGIIQGITNSIPAEFEKK